MSLESSIAALTQQAGLLMDLPQQVNAAAQAKLTAMGAAYNGYLAGLSMEFYVDQVVGSDAGSGAIGSPFESLEKALSLVPRGGRCTVYLKSDYTISAASVSVGARHLVLTSDSAVKRQVVFERYLNDQLTPALRGVRGFKLDGGSLSFIGLTINVPVLEGQWGNYAAANSHLVGVRDSHAWLPLDLVVYNCAINIPASPFCSLLEGTTLIDLLWSGNTLSGAVTSVNGRILADQTNTAGVSTTTLPSLRTNLATI